MKKPIESAHASRQPYCRHDHRRSAVRRLDARHRRRLQRGRDHRAAKAYGSAFLLPEFDLEEDLQEWVEDNVAWLFDFQLSAWTENEETWPGNRDLKTFREWFRIDIHSVVVDVADDDIEGEEL